jgi:DUF2407 C-terminal domain
VELTESLAVDACRKEKSVRCDLAHRRVVRSKTKGMQVRVLIAGREPPIDIDLSQHKEPTIAALERAIFESTALTPQRHRLRLIVDGRSLQNEECSQGDTIRASCTSLRNSGIQPGFVIHCGVSERAYECPDPFGNASMQIPILTTALSHHSNMVEGEQNLEVVTSLDHVAEGHDVALSASVQTDDAHTALSEVVVSSHSTSFLNIDSPSYVLRAPPVEFGQDAGPSIEDQDDMLGRWPDLFTGAVLGCGLGLIMLLLTLDKTIVFSKKFQDGIRLGVMCNFVFGLLLLYTEGAHVPLF